MTDTATLPVLYSFRRCPYAMRARMALAQAGQVVQLREVALRAKPQALLAVSPEATVPVLVLPDRVLTHSLDIMVWAWQGHDPDGWLARSDTPDNHALVTANDGAFKHALDRYKYAERFPEHPRSHYGQDAVQCLLAPLAQRLAQQPFLGGDTPCLTDLALLPFVRQFAAVDAATWDALPLATTQRWLSGWLGHPLFAQAMAKLPVWVPGATPVCFPAVEVV
ncbi:MAG: glutathione S-transferase [Pseudomonadota bacterium]